MAASATCSVAGCARPVYAKGLCNADYFRARRAAKGAKSRPSPRPDGVMLAPILLDPREDMLLRAAAELESVSVAEWVRRAIRVRLMREALERPELRELGNDVLAVIHISEGAPRGKVE